MDLLMCKNSLLCVSPHFQNIWNCSLRVSASDRSSHQMCSIRKTIRNCAKFTEKHLCQVPFLLEEETLAQVFSCEFCESSKNTSGRLLLKWIAMFVYPFENVRIANLTINSRTYMHALILFWPFPLS